MSGWAWVAIFWTISFAVISSGRACKGVLTQKVLRRIMPSVFQGANGHWCRSCLILFTVGPIAWLVVPNRLENLVYWSAQIAFPLDDWLFHGTDWRKKWDMVRNKIRWLMELPPMPEGKVAS